MELKTPKVIFSLFGYPIITKVPFDALPPATARDHFHKMSQAAPHILSADKADYLSARLMRNLDTAKHIVQLCSSKRYTRSGEILVSAQTVLFIEHWSNYFQVEHPDD